VGLAIFDRLPGPVQDEKGLRELMWKRREIECYFCTRGVILSWARAEASAAAAAYKVPPPPKKLGPVLAEAPAPTETPGPPEPPERKKK